MPEVIAGTATCNIQQSIGDMQHTRINGVASSSPRLSNLHGNGDTMIWGYDDEIHCYSLYRCAAIISVDAADTTINIAE